MSYINPFLYKAGPIDFNLRLIKQTKHCRHYLVDFPVVSANCYRGGEVARGEYFEPVNKEHAPLLILIHGWGNSVLPFRWMLPGLLRRGFACFILFLPFHPSRLPAEIKPHMSNLTPDEWFTFYQMAVTDVRRIIDWATQNVLANQRQISVIGLSMGAVVGSIAMGIEPRITTGVFLIHGGNTGKIMQTNSISRFGNKYRIPKNEYRENQKNYANYLMELADKGFENVTPLQRTYLIDPLTYAPMLKERPVLMINARWDEMFPQETSSDFWKACGECERVILFSTHASIWIWYPLIMRKINRFLKSSL